MPLLVFSTLAAQGALPSLAARYEELTGVAVESDFAPTNGLMARIDAGEMADVAILTREGIDQLTARAILAPDSVVDLARSYVGLAVRSGTAKPDIGTPEALKSALLRARSIAYSRIGASGIFFAGLIERLGIAEAINAKATIIASGFTAELVACGVVEMAVQQVSELIVVPGVDVVGVLPVALQTPATFSAAVFASSARRGQSMKWLDYLTSPDAAAALVAAGLVPVR